MDASMEEILTAAFKQKSEENKVLNTKIIVLVNRINALDSQCERARNLLNQLDSRITDADPLKKKIDKYMEDHYGEKDNAGDTDGGSFGVSGGKSSNGSGEEEATSET